MGDSTKSNAPKEKASGFWKSVKQEFSKIVWPNREDLLKQSVAVLCVSVVLGLIITFLDTLVQYGINFLTAI